MHYRNSLTDPPPPRSPWWDIGVVLLAVALLLACWLQWGCGERAAAAVVTHAGGAAAEALPRAPAPTSTAAADAQLKSLRDDRDELARQIELKDSTIGRVEKERDQLAAQDLRRRLAWLGGIVLIGVLACVGLWFVLPPGLKSWAVYGGLGCLGIAAAAFALRALVPYLELIGWVLVAAGAAFGLWKLIRFKGAAVEAAGYGEKLEQAFVGMKDWIPAEQHELVTSVKHEAATDQAASGVRGVLAALRGKDPKKATLAPAPGTPPPLPVVKA
jgi:hypothetical protein